MKTLGTSVGYSVLTSENTSLNSEFPWELPDLLLASSSVIQFLDLTVSGTFVRSTSGSYFTAAPTDGTSGFIAWALPNVRRIENRGDGNGQTLLLEGSRTNFALQSRDLTSATWSTQAGMITGSQPSPLGDSLAQRLIAALNGLGKYRNNAGMAASGFHVGSTWMRAVTGSTVNRFGFWENSGAEDGPSTVLSTTYSRTEQARTGSDTSTWIAPGDGRVFASSPASGTDQIVDMVQIEAGIFPTSFIATTTTQVTRAADTLTYQTGSYPATFLTNGFITTVIPDFSSNELTASTIDQHIFSVGISGTNAIDFQANSGTPRIALITSGSVIASQNCTWSRYQALTITVNMSASSIKVAGATTGNGTGTGANTLWPSGTLYIGAASDAAKPYFGRIATQITSL